MKKENITFEERLALLPATTPRGEIEAELRGVLNASEFTLDGVEYLAKNLEIKVDQMRVPEYLLLHSLIREFGGGINGDRIVLGVEPPPVEDIGTAPACPSLPQKPWSEFGREPENMSQTRIGRGVGGGMTKVYIWDMKTRIKIKQGSEGWTTETTLAFLGKR